MKIRQCILANSHVGTRRLWITYHVRGETCIMVDAYEQRAGDKPEREEGLVIMPPVVATHPEFQHLLGVAQGLRIIRRGPRFQRARRGDGHVSVDS